MKITIALTLFCLLSMDVFAQPVAASGSFVAAKACDMYQSKRKKTNPGGVRSNPGQTYAIMEVDKSNPAWVKWVRVKTHQQKSPERWVSVSCGKIKGFAYGNSGSSSNSHVVGRSSSNRNSCNTAGLFDSNILAISWQSAFCELKGSGLPECTSLTPSRYDASHFTLHGYWPNKASCGINYGYCGKIKKKPPTYCHYPRLSLTVEIRDSLGVVMPSEEYGTCLQRHEYWKHGSCSNMNPNEYYALSMTLLRQVNISSFVRQFMAGNIGKMVSRSALAMAFERAFGPGSSKRVAMQCKDGVLMELQLALPKTVKKSDSLRRLFTVPNVPGNGRGSCPDSFRIDAAN